MKIEYWTLHDINAELESIQRQYWEEYDDYCYENDLEEWDFGDPEYNKCDFIITYHYNEEITCQLWPVSKNLEMLKKLEDTFGYGVEIINSVFDYSSIFRFNPLSQEEVRKLKIRSLLEDL